MKTHLKTKNDVRRNSLASLVRTISDLQKEGILTKGESIITIITARKLERLLNH